MEVAFGVGPLRWNFANVDFTEVEFANFDFTEVEFANFYFTVEIRKR